MRAPVQALIGDLCEDPSLIDCIAIEATHVVQGGG
jgi:hypothetical protein